MSADVERGSPNTSRVSIVTVDSSDEGLFLDLGIRIDGKPVPVVSVNISQSPWCSQIRLLYFFEKRPGLLVGVIYNIWIIGGQGWMDAPVQSVLHPGGGVIGGVIGDSQRHVRTCTTSLFHPSSTGLPRRSRRDKYRIFRYDRKINDRYAEQQHL